MPSLEVFKKYLDLVLGDVVWWSGVAVVVQSGWLDYLILKVSSNPDVSMILGGFTY